MKKALITLLVFATALAAILCFASCNAVKFKIDFMVDGDAYDTVSTAGNESITIPNNPMKEGYTFDGWYWDDGIWQKPFTANSLLDAPLRSDMKVYAKWIKLVPECNHIDADDNSFCDECGETYEDGIDVITSSISFKTLTVNGNNVYGKVSNDTEMYSFIGEVEAHGNATYIVSYKMDGGDVVSTKTIPLSVGDNTVYITEYLDGEPNNIYIVTIRRRPTYEVTFDSNGGNVIDSVTVDEDTLLTAPKTTKPGYTFVSWDYDFSAPIKKDTNIIASWAVNANTPYTVEYYLENVDKTGYELYETENLVGTTDTVANAEIKPYQHFTHTAQNSVLSGNIDGEGILVLKVYYTRNRYKISSANQDKGSITNSGSYAYGTRKSFIAISNPGYKFIGWYSGNGLISSEASLTGTIDKDIEARFAIRSDMENFNFSSTVTTCTITGIKDKTATEIIVPDCVTSIGDYAFRGCSNLTSVTIPNSVTSIGGSAFSDCYKLAEVINKSSLNITAGSPDFGYIGRYAIEVHKDESKIVNVDNYLFYTYGGVNYLLGYIGNDTILTLPESYNGQNYEIYNYAFYDCDSLTSITIPDSVTSIGGSAFYGCLSLTSVTISNSVTNIGEYAFYGCLSLTSVTISNSVTNIGEYAFYGCYKLVEVINKSSLNITAGSSDYRYAKEVHKGESKIANIKDYLFYTYGGVNYLLGYIGNDTILTLPESYNGQNYEIYNYAFYDCTSLTSVTIPNSVTSIGNYAFYDCDSLTSVTIGNSVTSIGGSAFSGCSSLTSVTIPNSVTNIGVYAFLGCKSLTSITLPFVGAEKDGTNNTHFGYIFGAPSCSENTQYVPASLKTVVITGGNIIVENAFYKCASLTSVTIPESVESIGNAAFYKCVSLAGVTMGNGIISVGNYAFEGCISLTSVTIGCSVKSIGNYAFYNCTSLTSVTITESVESIGKGAFRGCRSLTSVTIGNGVTSIDEAAFYDCASLTKIKYRGTSSQWKKISKSSGWDSYTGRYTIIYNYDGE